RSAMPRGMRPRGCAAAPREWDGYPWLLHLEIGSRRGTANAPRGIQSRDQAGTHRDGDDDQEVVGIEGQRAQRLIDEAPIPGAHRPDAGKPQQPADHAARERYRAGLREVLPEDVAAAGTERAPYACGWRGVEELGEQQSD